MARVTACSASCCASAGVCGIAIRRPPTINNACLRMRRHGHTLTCARRVAHLLRITCSTHAMSSLRHTFRRLISENASSSCLHSLVDRCGSSDLKYKCSSTCRPWHSGRRPNVQASCVSPWHLGVDPRRRHRAAVPRSSHFRAAALSATQAVRESGSA
eukprot:364899-Chlamydomonas_euryale.AAC.8